MRAEAQSLKRIFQGAMRYSVPLYQRPYVWRHSEDDPENDRLGPFWEDVKQTVDRLVELRDRRGVARRHLPAEGRVDRIEAERIQRSRRSPRA